MTKKRTGNTVQLNVSINKSLMPQLKETALKEQRSLSNLVSWMLEKAMKELLWKRP